MSTVIPEARNRDDWAQVMDRIVQALGQSLDRCPEVPPDPPSSQFLLPLGIVDQNLVLLQDIVEQAAEMAQETDRALAEAAKAFEGWLQVSRDAEPRA